MKKPEPKKYLDSIKPYKGGVSRIEGIDKIYKLSSNSNPTKCVIAFRLSSKKEVFKGRSIRIL